MTYEGQAQVAKIMAYGLLAITGLTTAAIFLVPIPKGNETIAGQALGTLWGLLGAVVLFFYSTSSGNRKDSETIATLAQTNSLAQAALTPSAKPDVVVPAGETLTVKADDADSPKA
jgi:hypothetical protein